MHDLLNRQIDMYDNHKPNDESFLEVHIELNEEIKYIDNMIANECDGVLNKLNEFNELWFPDSIEQVDQEKYRQLIIETYKYIDEK